MTSRTLAFAGAGLAICGQLALIAAGSTPSTVSWSAVVLVLGTTLFALGVRDPARSLAEADRVGSFRRPRVSALVVAGLACLVLCARLARGSTSAADLLIWFFALAAFVVAFVAFPGSVSRLRRSHWLEAAFVASLMVLFAFLNGHDLTDWYYAAIGDEYSFYQVAVRILDHGLTNPFTQRGVHDSHPMLGSAYQAQVMALFGRDHFGWKIASVSCVVVAIPGVWILARSILGRGTAILATTFFSLSHYLFAYAHTGYNTLQPIPITVWSLAFLVLGTRHGSPLAFSVSGILAGWGFYTHFSARAIFPILVLFVCTDPRLRRRPGELWPMLVGFVLAAAPIFIVNRGEVWSRMISEAAGGYAESVSGPFGERIIANLSTNLVAFHHNPDMLHYVSGSLLDPVTATLALFGIGAVLVSLRRRASRLLAIWATVGFAVTGVASPYPEVAISRLSYLVPPLAILAALGAVRIGELAFGEARSRRRFRARAAAAGALCTIVFFLNVKRFWFETPRIFPLTQEAIAIGAMRSEACVGEPHGILFIDRFSEPLLKPALASYRSETSLPAMIGPDELTPGSPVTEESTRCVILVRPAEEGTARVLERLTAEHPSGRTISFQDPAGKRHVLLFVTGR